MDHTFYSIRMIDRVLAAADFTPSLYWRQAPRRQRTELLGWLQAAVKNAPVFAIDNVAEYFYAGNDKEEWHPETEFPCLAPPFPVFWMEWRKPSCIRSTVSGNLSTAGAPQYTGVLCSVETPAENLDDYTNMTELSAAENLQADLCWAQHGRRINEAIAEYQRNGGVVEKLWQMTPEVLQANLGLHNGEMLSFHLAVRRAIIEQRTPAQRASLTAHLNSRREEIALALPRWILRFSGWMYGTGQGGLIGPMGEWKIGVNADGSIRPGMYYQAVPYFKGASLSEEMLEVLSASNPLVFPVLMALTFLNCKNVTTTNQTPPVGVNERHQRKHKLPLKTFKTLKIEPLVQAIRRSGQGAGTAIGNPLHVCRGHFKDYRDRGLFGKQKGIYWWGNQVRGSVEHGIVFKDYEVA